MDWSVGEYERTATQLLPAARAVIDRAALRPGEHVVDVGCGTGNAALLASESGARVSGIDPAERLLGVARSQAQASGAEITFLLGEAAAMPLANKVADVLVSVFGVIFAPDAEAAAAEMARVTAPDGRIVMCAWMPGGALFDVIRIRREAVAQATCGPTGSLPFGWHEADALAGLFSPFGFSLNLREERLQFSAGSPREFLEAELREHPVWVASRALLEPRGEMQAVSDRALEIYTAANEEPGGFRVESHYVVATLHRR